MQAVFGWVGSALSAVMDVCYSICGNYGLAIILFTLVSKVILLPLTVWVHCNGMKMVRMLPAINRLRVNHYGDKDAIAEGQAELYRKEKYNPLAGVIPVLVQLVILLGLVGVIRDLLNSGAGEGMKFLGIDLGWVPAETGGLSLVVPVLAGGSALLMCVLQNRSQVLQSEQGKFSQYSVLVLSVGLSLYLGVFVPAGIALYWIASNLLSIAQMYLLNLAIPPKKHVDYEELEKSRAALAEIEALGGEKKGLFARDENAKREKADYKRFFSVRNKHLVFYSEKSGFWKYFKDIAEELLKRSNVRIHYVTNDPEDRIFEYAKAEPRIIPYYIGPKKIITLMMKMDADIVVMTTPDLENYHIKRSYIRKDIEYIYAPHDCMSTHYQFQEEAFDHFDTILCAGPHQVREIRKREEVFGLPAKNLVECGYCLLDDLLADRARYTGEGNGGRARILIAPSWSEDNILDSCIDELIRRLLREDRKIIVRPHPEYVKRCRPKLDALLKRWEEQAGEGLEFETDFSSNSNIYQSDVLITDWSGIATEFSFTTGRPSLFINTKPKVLNKNWEKLGIEPLAIMLRNQIGRSLDKDRLDLADETVRDMLEHPEAWSERIREIRERTIFHPGEAGKTAALYIIGRLTNRQGGNT